MINAQTQFPRLTPDTFTGPWSLPWFMLIPMRGKFLPANGTGIELSVFIGPVLAYLIWRNRQALLEELPHEMKIPLLIVSGVSIWLGMGSLRVVHVPVELSLFDWLRPLPGFRSMNTTGRYWGFLALPLSLLGAALPMDQASHRDSMLRIELNQVFHSGWKSFGCSIRRGDRGNLVVDCPVARVQADAIDLTFFDPVSALGASVSLRTAAALGFVIHSCF